MGESGFQNSTVGTLSRLGLLGVQKITTTGTGFIFLGELLLMEEIPNNHLGDI